MRNRLYLFVFIFVLFVFFPLGRVSAATGFLNGPMWIDPETPSQGDLVTLSAVFHNAEQYQLSGEVSFYDANLLLGQKNIVIPSGGVSTAVISFRIGAGDHMFIASTGSMHITLPSGIMQVFAMAPETVSLPKISVASNAGSTLAASVTTSNVTNNYNSSSNSATNPLLTQIDNAQNKVLDALPDSIKTPIGNTLTSLDSWRAKNSNNMVQSSKESADSLKKINALIDSQEKNFGKVEPSEKFVNRPFAYVKFFFYKMMSFLYSHPFIFYLVGFFTLGIILRFMYKKIFRKRVA